MKLWVVLASARSTALKALRVLGLLQPEADTPSEVAARPQETSQRIPPETPPKPEPPPKPPEDPRIVELKKVFEANGEGFADAAIDLIELGQYQYVSCYLCSPYQHPFWLSAPFTAGRERLCNLILTRSETRDPVFAEAHFVLGRLGDIRAMPVLRSLLEKSDQWGSKRVGDALIGIIKAHEDEVPHDLLKELSDLRDVTSTVSTTIKGGMEIWDNNTYEVEYEKVLLDLSRIRSAANDALWNRRRKSEKASRERGTDASGRSAVEEG